MSTSVRARAAYLLLALATIALGLWVYRGGAPLGDGARDVAGDSLWAMMITWGMGALWLHRALAWRGAAAMAVCTAVEVSQLLHTPWLDALRRTLPGRLVLGSDFDARDLLAYAAGVLMAVLLERVATRALRARPAV